MDERKELAAEGGEDARLIEMFCPPRDPGGPCAPDRAQDHHPRDRRGAAAPLGGMKRCVRDEN